MNAPLRPFAVFYRSIRNCLVSFFFTLFLALPSLAQDFTAKSIGDYGNVTVMEVSGNYDARYLTGNSVPRQLIAKEFFKAHKDEYDFLVIFSNFDFIMPEFETLGFYHSVKNDVDGIGQERYNNTNYYGSSGRLQGTIDMGNIAANVSDPLDPKFDGTLGVLTHEMLHRWSSYVKFKDWNGTISNKLIGQDGSHWSFLLDSKGSLQYGNQWRDNGNGTFTSVGSSKIFSPLDLYLMGMIDKSQVPPMLLIDNPSIDHTRMPEVGVTISGTPRQVTIDDIIAAEGERVPSAKDAQKQFKTAFIFITSPGTFTGRELDGIENIRNGILTRFSILTDGKALLQVASTPREDLPFNPGVRPPTTTPRTLPPNVEHGVSWLAEHQLTDGSWTDFALTTERDTAESVTTLQRFPVAQQQFQAGLAWLANNASANTDFLARRLEAAAQTGGEAGTLVSELISRRNPDGGWGSGRNFISNPTDTALALKALARAGYADQQSIAKAITYLKSAQNSDGGWSGDDTVSMIQPTAAVLAAFNAHRKSYSLEENIGRAVTFLTGKQNVDGGFGNSPSTIYDSSVAIMALQEVGADKDMVGRGVAYLSGLQSGNGSWQESPYQTALAVRAVWQATVDPELSVTAEDISFIPEKVTSLPTTAVVNAVVTNLGRSDVPQAKVAIYDGAVAPDRKVGEQTVAIPGMSQVTLTFLVPITDGKGHAFTVVVDPDGLIKEINRNNNIAQKPLLPETTYDFEVLTEEMTLSQNPTDILQDLKIGVKVHNKGTSDAYNVPVRVFIAGGSDPALEIASLSMDIPAGGMATREVIWKTNKAGIGMPLTIQADPSNAFSENSEENNQATVAVTVNGSTLPNLTVSYQDLLVVPTPAKQGDTATLSVIVKNEGYSDTANVNVHFYNGVPGNDALLLGTQLIPLLAAGQSIKVENDWTGIDVAGTTIVSVVIDPDAAVAETRKDDNFAFTTCNILTLPDLSISSNSVVLAPASPKEGDQVSVAVTVQNAGEQDVKDVAVQISEAGIELGSVVIAAISGKSQAIATITLSSVVKGAHQLTVAVDPLSRINEGNKGDNTVLKSFMVQNEDLWVSESHFSPNGDGNKDITQLSFILKTSATVNVVVENNDGEVIRIFRGGELDNTSGAVVTWDGRDDTGLLVPDGLYRLQIKDSGGVLLGSASVVLDTNRSTLLDAIQSNSMIYNKLLSNLSSVGSWTWLADDSGIVIQVGGGHPDFSPGIYFISSDGLDAHRIISGETASITSFDVSPVTGNVAAVLSTSTWQSTSTTWSVQNMVVTTDIYGAVIKQVVSFQTNYKRGSGGAALIAQDQYNGIGPIKWSNNGDRLMYSFTTFKKIWEGSNFQQYAPEVYNTFIKDNDGASVAAVDSIANLTYFSPGNVTWSPDDEKIAFFANNTNTSDITYCRIIDTKNSDTARMYPLEYPYVTQQLWFTNSSLFVTAQNSSGIYPAPSPTRRGIYLIELDKAAPIKLGEQSTLRWKKIRGPYISPDRTRFAYSTEEDIYTTSLRLRTADGTSSVIYQLHTPTKYASDPPVLDTVTWSPDGKQLTFIEWDILSVNANTLYGPYFVTLDADTGAYKKYKVASTYVGKERFISWLNDGQDVLGIHNGGTGYSWPNYSYLNYYLFNSATGAVYPWLQNQISDFLQVSPQQHHIAYKKSSGDTWSASNLWAASSYLNLSCELRIIRKNSALELKGTVDDAGFEGYKIEYSDIATPSEWTLLSPPSDVPVHNGTLATWVPPHQGMFLVRLTAWDKAGNVASSVKKVMWNVSSSTITNIFKTLDIFSPNGDGTKDTLELSYTVLQPVHLEFTVSDASGKVVRTFLKQYAQTTSDSISWDGRDEAGYVVADGVYKIKVLDFEFLTTVDTSAPVVTAALSPITSDSAKNLFFLSFDALAYDDNLKSWKIEYGEGDNPTEWQKYDSGSAVLAAKDTNNNFISPLQQAQVQRFESSKMGNNIVWLKGKRLRLTAEDYAGNERTILVNPVEERIVLSYWDERFIPNNNVLPGYATNIIGFETTNHGAVDLVMQQWDGLQWHDSPVAERVNGGISLSWSNPSPAAVYGVRAKGVDSLGGLHYSNVIKTMEMFQLYSRCSDGPDGGIRGVNAVVDSLKSLRLQVRSSDDARLFNWTDYQAFDTSKGETVPRGDFVLPYPDSKPGYHYQIRMAGTGTNSQESYTNTLKYPDDVCRGSALVGSFPLHVTYDEAKSCGEVAPGLVTLAAGFPAQVTGDLSFQTLTYSIQKAEGWQPIRTLDLHKEQWSSVRLATTELAEGQYAVKATLAFMDRGDFNRIKEASSSAVMRVDRILPITRITYPVGTSAKVCPSKVSGPAGSWFGIPVEATVTDNGKLKKYELYYGAGSNPDQWLAATAPAIDGNVVINKQLTGDSAKNGSIGIWDTTAVIGSATLKLKATDDSGNISCSTGTVTLETAVGVPLASLDKLLLSPNLDGAQSEVKLTFQIDKDASVEVNVYRLLEGVLDSKPVRSLVTAKPLSAGVQVVTWNGRSDSDMAVPDGRYALVVSATDSCGNTASRSAVVEIDGTSPETAIIFPVSGDPLTNIIEIKGTAADGHFQEYTLQAGEGSAPSSWSTVKTGTLPVEDGILGTWNTFEHQGIWTLRITATDKAGNKNSAQTTIDLGVRKNLIKSLQLTPRILSPNGDSKQDTSKVSVEVTDASEIKIEIANSAEVTVSSNVMPASSAGIYEYIWSGNSGTGAALPDGAYKVKVTAVLASNVSVSQTETVSAIIDTANPVTEMKYPGDKAYLNIKDLTATGSATDSNLASYSLKITGPSGIVVDDAGTQNRSDYTFGTVTDIAEGAYAVSFEAKDGGENSRNTTSSFTVDHTPPKVVLDTPKTGGFFGGENSTVDLTGSVSEQNFDSYLVRYGTGDNPLDWKELVSSASLPTTSNIFTWKVGKNDGIADGDYTLSFSAKDKAGQEGEVRIRTVVDNTLPEVAIASLTNGGYVNGAVDIKGTAYDLNYDKAWLELSEGGCDTAFKWTTIKNITAPVNEGVLAGWTALPTDGTYCLSLSVMDKSGNKAKRTVTVKVDSHPPAVPVLTGKIEANKTDVTLQWSTSSETDTAGYNLYRNGQRVNTVLLSSTMSSDIGLQQGSYAYAVKSVDLAGNESAASNLVNLKIDLAGPSARITTPAANVRVGGTLDIYGTATGSGDFKEYRVLVGPGSNPETWNLIRKSPVPVPLGLLAQWNSIGSAEGTRSIKVEAEDLSGNISTHIITVTVDNTAPGRPLISSVVATGQDVTINWSSNVEPDLAGYLLFRNDQLVNASSVAITDLKPFALNGITYADGQVPDGTYRYFLMAMDQAGNLSPTSEEKRISIDTHPPHAAIVDPANGTKFEGQVAIRMESPDNDVASIRLQYRRAGENSWNNVDQTVNSSPYIITFDAKTLGYGEFQMQAIATDNGGRVDPSPSVITIFQTDLTAPTAPVNVQKRVTGSNITLSWDDNKETDIDGYNIYRSSGSSRTKVNGSLVKSLGYLDTVLADGTYSYEIKAVDTFGNEGAPSNSQFVTVFTPVLVQPLSPVTQPALQVVGSNAGPNSSVEVFNDTAAGRNSVAKAVSDAAGNFVAEGITLSSGLNTITAVATDSIGNISKPTAAVQIKYVVPPSAPTGLTVAVDGYKSELQWAPNPETDVIGYNVYRDGERMNLPLSVTAGETTASSTSSSFYPSLAFDSNASTGWLSGATAGYLPPSWWQITLPSRESITHVEVDWFGSASAREFKIQGWNGSDWVTLASKSNNSLASNAFDISPSLRTEIIRLYVTQTNTPYYYKNVGITEVRMLKESIISQRSWLDDNLKDKIYSYRVAAVNADGFEGPLSDEIAAPVGDVNPPVPPQGLRANVIGSDVFLSWTANGEGDLAGYAVYRYSQQGWIRVSGAGLVAGTAYADLSLANGTYRYRISAIDLVQNESLPSDELEVQISVELPAPPTEVTVSQPSQGKSLELHWQAGGAVCNIYRSLTAGGPYLKLNPAPVASTSYLDAPLSNGTRYFYVATAVDASGNEGAMSTEASGIPLDTSAPAQPVIFYPTTAGVPLQQHKSSIDIAGYAESGTDVELVQDNLTVAKVTAFASDTATQKTLTFTSSAYCLSPDGTQLAYYDSATSSLYVRDLATNAVTFVATSGSSPSWSPEGDKLAYVYPYGNSRVGILDRSTGSKTTLTADSNVSENYPSWSTDGSKVVFVSNRGGTQDVWMKDLMSGALQQITSGLTASYPRLSPNGTRISYFQGVSIVVKDIGSGTFKEVDSKISGSTSSWSPDGNNLAFISTRNGYTDLYVYGVDSESLRQITNSSELKSSPAWSVDSKSVAYARRGADFWYSLMLAGPEGESTALKDRLFSPASLMWSASGPLYYVDGYSITTAYVKGAFSFGAVKLDSGVNGFHVVAVDDSGNSSPPSEGISVFFDADQLPDISVSADEILVSPAVPKPGEQLSITAVARNNGDAAVQNAVVNIYLWEAGGDLRLIKSEAVSSIPAGNEVAIHAQLPEGITAGTNHFIVIVDPSNTIMEADENNNYASKDVYATGQAEVLVTAALDSLQYGAGEDVLVTVSLRNSDRELDGVLRMVVEDGEGSAISVLHSGRRLIPYGINQMNFTWNTGSTFAGSYKVHAVFTGADGNTAESSTSFEILPELRITSVAFTDKKGYGTNEAVSVTVNLNNSGRNSVASGLKLKLAILDSNDTVLLSEETGVPYLFPGSATTIVFPWNTGQKLPGSYRAVVDTYLGDDLIYSSEAPFVIQPVSKLTGTVSIEAAEVMIGNEVKATFQVSNIGNATASGAIVAFLTDPASDAVIAAIEQPVALPVNGSQSGELGFSTEGLQTKTYLVRLQYLFEGGKADIASANFTARDMTPPVVAIVSPAAGATYNATISVAALASDEGMGVAMVEYQLDNGGWRQLPLGDYASGRYAVTWSPTSTDIGLHTVSFRATDRANNTSTPVSTTFNFEYVRDYLPPVLWLSTLGDGASTNEETLNIAGSVWDDTGLLNLQVNGVSALLYSDGSFSHPLTLQSGTNVVTTTATDLAGNSSIDVRTIKLLLNALLTITAPADNTMTGQALVTVSGTADATSSVVVTLGGQVQAAVRDGEAFTADVILAPGPNTILITATSTEGVVVSRKRTVLYDDQKPSLSVSEPSQDLRTNQGSIMIKGAASDPWTAVGVSIDVDGKTLAPPLVNGLFEQLVTLTEEKIYAVNVTATNEVGAQVTIQRNVIHDITPPVLAIDKLPSQTNQSSLSISGTREDGTDVAVTCTTAVVGEVSYPTPTTWSSMVSQLQLGENTVTATSSDAAGNGATASAKIVFIERAPDVTVTATPNVIWSPDRKMVPVTLGGEVIPHGSDIQSVSLTVADEYRQFFYKNLNFGDTVMLEAWRDGRDFDGRVYTITAVATDKAGNTTTKTTIVRVIHDQAE